MSASQTTPSPPPQPVIVIRYNSVWQANQELAGIHNDAAQEELVKIFFFKFWLLTNKSEKLIK